MSALLTIICFLSTPMFFANYHQAAEIKLTQLLGGEPNEPITTDIPKPTTKQKRRAPTRQIDYSRLDVRVGQIISVQEVVTAHNLYVEEIDVGETITRTVISGLVDQIPLEELENRKVVVLCNLKPRKMKGYVSEGMILCANAENKVEVLEPPYGSTPGDKVTVAGYNGTADKVLNPKRKIFETVSADLMVNIDKVACYKGIPLEVLDKGFIKTETLTNASII